MKEIYYLNFECNQLELTIGVHLAQLNGVQRFPSFLILQSSINIRKGVPALKRVALPLIR